MKLAFAMFIFFSLCFFSGAVSAQESKPAAIPGEWVLNPLALVGSPAPGTSGRFEFIDLYFYQPVFTNSGIVAFWANSRPKDKDWGFRVNDYKVVFGPDDEKYWGLYSIKDGKVARILGEAEPLTVIGTDKAKVERSYEYLRMNALVPGKDLLYINASQSLWMGKASIFAWDGSSLKLFLGNDSQIEIDGVTYNVMTAFARVATSDGKVFLTCQTNKPKNKIFELIHDGVKFTPVRPILELVEDKPLPGLTGVLFDSFPMLPQPIPPVYYDGGMIAHIKVKGASYKQAAFRVTAEKVEKILALGEADPFDSTKKVQSIAIAAADKNNVALVISSSKKYEPYLALYRDGKFQKIFDNGFPSVKDKSAWRDFQIGGGSFPNIESSGYFFRINFHRKAEIKGYDYEIIPHYFYFDGTNVHHLSEIAQTTQSTRTIWLSWLGDGAFKSNGILFRGVGASGFRLFDKGYAYYVAPSLGDSWLLEASGKEFSFKPAPEFNVPGKKVSLGNLIGWKSPTEAFVRLDDGIYSISRLP